MFGSFDRCCSAVETTGKKERYPVRIVDIRETVVPIKSEIRNAYIDFSQMTVSVLALVTDVVRDGKPVIGYGFNSNGRYAPSGLLRDRFIPRLKAAPSESLLDRNRLRKHGNAAVLRFDRTFEIVRIDVIHADQPYHRPMHFAS